MPRKAQIPHLRIRIEPRLLGRLEKSREKSGRTLTGEIVERLEASFQREDRQAELETAAERGVERFLKRATAAERAAFRAGEEAAAADDLKEEPKK
jgi:hypothetical protein